MPPRRDRANVAVRVLLLAAAVGLTFGAAGLLVWTLANGGLATSTTRVARAYLIDVKDANYAQAYRRLCAPQESLEAYSTRLADARSRGHRITSFRLSLTFTKETLRLKSATGKVRFADGSVENVLYDVERPGCLDAFDDLSG